MKHALFALLSLAALVAGGWAMGWQGVVLVLTALVFLLLLQFTQLMRLMKRMQAAPLGLTASCVMLQSKLQPGLPLTQVLTLAGSLGERVGEEDEPCYLWHDAGGDRLRLRFDPRSSRLLAWNLERAS